MKFWILWKKQPIDNTSYEICGFKIITNLTYISNYIINSNKPCPTISINPFAQLTQHETISSAVPVFFPHFSKQLLITFRGVAMPTEPTEGENNWRGNQYHKLKTKKRLPKQTLNPTRDDDLNHPPKSKVSKQPRTAEVVAIGSLCVEKKKKVTWWCGNRQNVIYGGIDRILWFFFRIRGA